MADTLMELVEGCDKADKFECSDKFKDKLVTIRSLGFEALGDKIISEVNKKQKLRAIGEHGYIKITNKKIMDFLKRKADAYNREAQKLDNPFTNVLAGNNRAMGFGQMQALQNSQWHMQQQMNDGLLTTSFPFTAISGKCYEENFVVKTNDANSFSHGTTGRYEWSECQVQAYMSLPPDNVLETFREHKDKKIFDYFTIAKVNGIVDPLLLGRLESHPDRYFIAQWGDDVCLDDLI